MTGRICGCAVVVVVEDLKQGDSHHFERRLERGLEGREEWDEMEWERREGKGRKGRREEGRKGGTLASQAT